MRLARPRDGRCDRWVRVSRALSFTTSTPVRRCGSSVGVEVLRGSQEADNVHDHLDRQDPVHIRKWAVGIFRLGQRRGDRSRFRESASVSPGPSHRGRVRGRPCDTKGLRPPARGAGGRPTVPKTPLSTLPQASSSRPSPGTPPESRPPPPVTQEVAFVRLLPKRSPGLPVARESLEGTRTT